MEYIWQSPGDEAKQICQNLELSHQSSLSTVQTTLERLVRKQFLARKKSGHAFRYFPQLSRSELLGNLMGDVIKLLHDGRTDTILSSFVNVAAEIDDTALDELEAMIRKKRLQRGTGDD
ncbi:MAG: BlaI/MecI/CopY family transcriptional regulator [Pseudomonadales bacterium]